MRKMSAKNAKNHFGELLMEAQRAPVTIEKNGKPVAVLLSFEEHEEIEKLKLDRLRAMIAEADEAVARGEVYEWTDELMADIRAEGEALLKRTTQQRA
jgi:prevent-host-death family protein